MGYEKQNRVEITILVASLMTFLAGCPAEEGFGVGDDDTLDEPEPMPEAWCHLKGSFFRATSAVGAFTELDEEDPDYDELHDISCDFDGDDADETYYLHHDAIQWLDSGNDESVTPVYSYARNHSSSQHDAYLNGGKDGIRPILYVGGVDKDDHTVFLWMSYHGTPTFMGYSGYYLIYGPTACAPIWSWENGGTEIPGDTPDLPVSADITGYCTDGGLYSGHVSHTCRFGFFPLGIFDATIIGSQAEMAAGNNTSVEYYDPDVAAVDLLESMDCESDPEDVDDAMDNSVLRHLNISSLTFLGTEYNAFQDDDSLKGINWNGTGGVDDNTTLVFDYITRDVVPSTFQDDIEAVQEDVYSFDSTCGC